MSQQVEWQVVIEVDGVIHIHMFETERQARRFSSALPRPVCHEGGIWSTTLPCVRKLIRHKRRTHSAKDPK